VPAAGCRAVALVADRDSDLGRILRIDPDGGDADGLVLSFLPADLAVDGAGVALVGGVTPLNLGRLAAIDAGGETLWSSDQAGATILTAVGWAADGSPLAARLSPAAVLRVPDPDGAWENATLLGLNEGYVHTVVAAGDGVIACGNVTEDAGFVAKLDAALQLLWKIEIRPEPEWTPGGGSFAEIRHCTVTADGRVLAAGFRDGWMDTPDGYTQMTEAIAVELAADGEELWRGAFAADGERTEAWDVAELDDGSLVIAGSLRADGTPMRPRLVKLGPDRALEWAIDYPELEGEARTVAPTPGGLLVAGGVDTLSLNAGFLMRTDAAGDLPP
jgi:hypothetical protein